MVPVPIHCLEQFEAFFHLHYSEFYVIIYLYNRHVITVLNDETIFFFTSLSIWSVVHVLLPVNLCLLRATHLYIAVLRQSGMIFDSLTADRKSTRLNSSHVSISY